MICRDKMPESVMIDEKRLQQVVFNLLSNAIKFTVRGKIELTYGLSQDKSCLEVQVAD
jgi:signal transduction histidine kinase